MLSATRHVGPAVRVRSTGQRNASVSAMNVTVKNRIKQQFEERAASYDIGNEYHPPLAEKLLQLCQLQPGQHLLDLASGTGMVALPGAAQVGPKGYVFAVDLSPSMIQQAQTKAAAQGLSNIHFICGDMEQLQQHLPRELAGLFDATTCSAAVPFLTQPQETLADWRQWLKPGGKLAFNAFVPPALEGYDVFIEMARNTYGCQQEFDPSSALGSPELVTAALQAANYRDVQVTPEARIRWIPAGNPSEYAEKVWMMALNNNPFRSAEELRLTLGDSQLQAFHNDFAAHIVAAVSTSDRFDQQAQRVSSTYTMLHVLATA